MSLVSPFPAIRMFAAYALLALVCDFILQCTLFAACMALDVRRIYDERTDWVGLPISCSARCTRRSNKEYGVASLRVVVDSLLQRLARVLGDPRGALVTVLVGVAIAVALCVQIPDMKQSLDLKTLSPSESPLYRYHAHLDQGHRTESVLDLVLPGLSACSATDRREVMEAVQDLVGHDSAHLVAAGTVSWVEPVEAVVAQLPPVVTCAQAGLPAVVTNSSTAWVATMFANTARPVGEIVEKLPNVTRVRLLQAPESDFNVRARHMQDLRAAVAALAASPSSKVPASSFVTSEEFIMLEQSLMIMSNVQVTMFVTWVAVAVCLGIFLHEDLASVALASVGVAVVIVELLGWMVMLNVSLDAVALVNLSMGLGFLTDYQVRSGRPAHVLLLSTLWF